MRIRFGGFIVAGCLALVWIPNSSRAAAPISILATVEPTNSAGGVGSYAPSLSADGRYVVFQSHAKNLITNSSWTPFLDVFVHDLVTHDTTLVSAGRFGHGGQNGDTSYPVISSNGRHVAFASSADNLVPNDTNETRDVFVCDLANRVTSPVSVGIDGELAANHWQTVTRLNRQFQTKDFNLSGNPSISPDGRWVVFESGSTNLTMLPDTNAATDIFIRDLHTGSTGLLSVGAAGDSAASASSGLASTSADARRVAFVSYATDIVAGVTNTRGDIYVRDLDAGTTAWASTNVASFFSDGLYRCFAPVLSGNGAVVAFKAAAADAPTGLMFRYEYATGRAIPLSSNSPIATSFSLSHDGRFLAYDDGTNVYLWDQQSGSNRLVSARFNGTDSGNGPSLAPVLSANGRTVAFVSKATDLVSDQAADTNALFQIYARDLPTGTTRLLTADNAGRPVRVNHLLANLSLSADGTRVAFDSRSGDLVPGDGNRESDVFVVDLAGNETRLISRRAESRPSVSGARQVRIAPNCVSTNGRYLLFASVLKSSPGDDATCCANLLIRDLVTGVEEPVTDSDMLDPKEFALSADARHVAYIVRAITRVRNESVVMLNRDTGARVLANIDPDSGGLLTSGFHGLTLSPEGDRVAYVTGSAASTSGLLYVFDSVGATNRRLASNSALYTARFSPDGRRLVFGNIGLGGLNIYDFATNGVSHLWSLASAPGFVMPSSFSADSRLLVASKPWLEMFDLANLTFRTVDTNYVRNPLLSANGVWVAYEDYGQFPHPDGTFDIRVRHLPSGAVKSATRSLSGSGSGNGRSKLAGFGPDGRFVVFTSRASDLVAGDTNNLSDVFAHDRITGATYLLSVNRDGTSSGNAASSIPTLSADGRTVIFQSFADDLVEGDYNSARDIFIARLGGADSDGDGMDDDWEMAYFESLARSGSGDLDGDGVTDRQEFLAGTDPTNLGSVLQVITVAPLEGGQCMVQWASVPGRTYAVQFKDGVDAAEWTTLPGAVTATGATASVVDPSATAAHRYYRVVVP